MLASRTTYAWAQQAVTLFADDSHFTWEVRDIADLKFLVKCVRATFQTFREFGMQLNMDKSRIVVKLQGGAAKHWLKPRTQRSANGPVMQLGTPHAPIVIPRVHSMVYLGIIASYSGFEQQTFVLRSKRLQLHQRARLYLACVRSSLLYGLHAVGVTNHVARRIEQFDSRALRSLARSPAFLSHESTASLRQRLGPWTDTRATKCRDPQELQWFRAKQLELFAILQQPPTGTSLQPTVNNSVRRGSMSRLRSLFS